eukprot:377543-Rhodomonas_salina.1
MALRSEEAEGQISLCYRPTCSLQNARYCLRLCCYAPAMECPATLPCARYGMRGTDLGYAATSPQQAHALRGPTRPRSETSRRNHPSLKIFGGGGPK